MPNLQQTEPVAPATLGQTGGPKVADVMSEARKAIYQKVQDIQATRDPETKLGMISDLAASSRQFAADTKKAITERNIAESRIPLLKQRIQQEDAGGAASMVGNIINAKFGLPNTGTQLRRNMDDEVQHVNKKVAMEFDANPDIVAIASLHDAHGFLATQTALASRAIGRKEQDQIRDENAALTLQNTRETGKIQKQASFDNSAQLLQMNAQQRQLDRQQKQDEQQQQLYDAITPEQRDVARAYSGKAPGDSSVDSFLVANIKRDKNFAAAVSQADSPDGMVSLALSGNPQAAKIAVNKQAEQLSGETDPMSQKYRAAKATATEDMRFMNRIVNTSADYESALDTVYGPKGAAKRTKYLTSLQNETALLSPKDKLAAQTQAKTQLAKDALMVENQKRFVNNVSSWPAEFTKVLDVHPIFQKLAEQKGRTNVSVEDMIKGITALPDPTVKAEQMKNFEFLMNHAAQQLNQGYFGFAVDGTAVKTNISQNIARSLRGDTQSALLAGAQSFFNPLSKIKQGIEDLTGTDLSPAALDQKYGIMDYIRGK